MVRLALRAADATAAPATAGGARAEGPRCRSAIDPVRQGDLSRLLRSSPSSESREDFTPVTYTCRSHARRDQPDPQLVPSCCPMRSGALVPGSLRADAPLQEYRGLLPPPSGTGAVLGASVAVLFASWPRCRCSAASSFPS